MIDASFPYLILLVLGGMGTRGFGWVEFFTLKNNKQSNNKMEGNEDDKSRLYMCINWSELSRK